MKAYVTKKENICVFTAAGQKPRGKGSFRTRKDKENYKTIESAVSSFIQEFNGEIVDALKVNIDLYPVRNLI